MRWWWNSNHYIRWWHNMEACLLFCLGPSHRDNRPPARLYSYYYPHCSLMKIYLHKDKQYSALFYHSNQTVLARCKFWGEGKVKLLRDVRCTITAVMVAAANSVLATASSLEAHNCCNAHSLSGLLSNSIQPGLLSNSSCFNTLGPCGWSRKTILYIIYIAYISADPKVSRYVFEKIWGVIN